MTENQTTTLGSEIVKLPSKGKLYSVTHPLHNKETIDVHYMTGNEEDILTSPALIKRGLVFSTLLKSCIVDKTIDPDELLVCDRNAIMVVLRATSYGNDYKVSITCEETRCGEKFEHSFDLGKLPIKFIKDEDVEAIGVNRFNMVLPISKKKISFKLLDCKDDREIDLNEERAKKAMPNVLVEKRITSRLLQEVIEVDGNPDKSEIARIIGKLKAGDTYALRKRIKEITPSIVMQQEAVCSHCGTTNIFDIPITAEFFWPSL